MDRNGEHSFANYLGLSLWISSKELMPDKVTQIVGIEPSYVRVRGTLIPGRGVSRRPEFDVHEWQFRKQLDLKPGNCAAQDFEKTGEHPELGEVSILRILQFVVANDARYLENIHSMVDGGKSEMSFI